MSTKLDRLTELAKEEPKRQFFSIRRMVPGAPTCTGGRAAEDPQRQAPRPLPVLRPTDKLSEPSEVLSGRRTDLEEVAESSHARKPVDVGAIYRAPTTSSVAAASDSPCLDVPGESGLRNPLREICTVGSVREEISRWCQGGPNGHEAGNGGYSQGKPIAYRDSSTRRDVVTRRGC